MSNSKSTQFETPMRLVFLGTPEFAIPTLRALMAHSDLVNIVAVYTQPDRPSGRGQRITKPPVKLVAEEFGLSVFQPENINAADEKSNFSHHLADIAVVVAYAQFLSPAILNTPRLGCINLHPSLLPKYRGPSPIQAAILNGDHETGVTTMRLVSEMDAGPILLQKPYRIESQMTAAELQSRLAEIGSQAIIETLTKIANRTSVETPQDPTQVTFCKLFKKEDGQIYWAKKGEEIIRQIRAFDPWPGSFMCSSRGNIKVQGARFHSKVHGAPSNAEPGFVFSGSGGIWIKCLDGWIEVLRLQPEGKKTMTVDEYTRGLQAGSVLQLR